MGRQAEGETKQPIILTIKNYEEVIPTMEVCSEFASDATDEEWDIIFEALEEKGILTDECFEDEEAVDDVANEVSRRRAGKGRPRNGPRRSNIRRRVQQQRRARY